MQLTMLHARLLENAMHNRGAHQHAETRLKMSTREKQSFKETVALPFVKVEPVCLSTLDFDLSTTTNEDSEELDSPAFDPCEDDLR